MESNYITISEYAKRMSMNTRTVYRKYHAGKIEGFQEEETGTIRLKNPFLENNVSKNNNRVAIYVRVSSSMNKSNLDSQLERVKIYCNAKGYQVTQEVKEIASGLNDERPKFINLITKNIDTFDKIVVEHKDRLTRFGFNYIKQLLLNQNKEIEVINEVVEEKEDLVQDFVSIITSFCARIYGQRRSKRKTEKILEDLKDE